MGYPSPIFQVTKLSKVCGAGGTEPSFSGVHNRVDRSNTSNLLISRVNIFWHFWFASCWWQDLVFLYFNGKVFRDIQEVQDIQFFRSFVSKVALFSQVVHIDAPVVVHHCFQLLSSSTLGQDGQATLHQWKMHLGIARIFFSLEVLKCIAPLVGHIWDMFLMMDPNQQDLDTVSTVFACGTIQD